MLPFGRQRRREAVRLLNEHLGRYRDIPYGELRELIDDPDTFEVRGETGKEYQIEINAFWDREPNGDLRVLASIDDGLLTACVNAKPFVQGFVVRPDGQFVGE